MRHVPAAIAGALGDLVGQPLRLLALGCAALALTLLAAAVWGAITYVVPLIPWQGWLRTGAEIVASLLTIVLAFVLLPTVAAILGGLLIDVAAARVERLRFPADPTGQDLPPNRAIGAGLRLAALALPLNLLALPLYFVPVLNVLVYWTLNGFLLGREYFTLAALRFRDWDAARALRLRHGAAIFAGGLAMAVALTIPVLNLAAPLFGIALMVRLHKALARA